MSEDTKKFMILVIGVVLTTLVATVGQCVIDSIALEETKLYLEKGYHKVDGDWLQ